MSGCGSIVKRHINNLALVGANQISAFESIEEKLVAFNIKICIFYLQCIPLLKLKLYFNMFNGIWLLLFLISKCK